MKKSSQVSWVALFNLGCAVSLAGGAQAASADEPVRAAYQDSLSALLHCHQGLSAALESLEIDSDSLPYNTAKSHSFSGLDAKSHQTDKGIAAAAYSSPGGLRIYYWNQAISPNPRALGADRPAGKACTFRYPTPAPSSRYVVFSAPSESDSGRKIYFKCEYTAASQSQPAKCLPEYPNSDTPKAVATDETLYDGPSGWCQELKPASDAELRKDLDFRFAGMAQYLDNERKRLGPDAIYDDDYAKKRKSFQEVLEAGRDVTRDFDGFQDKYPLNDVSNHASWYLQYLDYLPTAPVDERKESDTRIARMLNFACKGIGIYRVGPDKDACAAVSGYCARYKGGADPSLCPIQDAVASPALKQGVSAATSADAH